MFIAPRLASFGYTDETCLEVYAAATPVADRATAEL